MLNADISLSTHVQDIRGCRVQGRVGRSESLAKTRNFRGSVSSLVVVLGSLLLCRRGQDEMKVTWVRSLHAVCKGGCCWRFFTIALGGAGLPGTRGWASLRVRSTIQSIPCCGGGGILFRSRDHWTSPCLGSLEAFLKQ